MSIKNNIFAFTLTVFLCFFACGCGNPVIFSQRLEHEIDIEKNFNELKETLVCFYYNDNTRVSVGVGNDDKYIYICLLTHNRGLIEQFESSGLTVWFDSNGGKTKTLGVRLFTSINGGNSVQGKTEPSSVKTFGKKIEIIGPGKKERYTTDMETAQKNGIIVKTGNVEGCFVYELKVPLKEDGQHPYAINPAAGKAIGVGFEPSAFGRGMPRGGLGADEPGDDIDWMGRGGMGPGIGMPGMDELEFWLKVILA